MKKQLESPTIDDCNEEIMITESKRIVKEIGNLENVPVATKLMVIQAATEFVNDLIDNKDEERVKLNEAFEEMAGVFLSHEDDLDDEEKLVKTEMLLPVIEESCLNQVPIPKKVRNLFTKIFDEMETMPCAR